MRAHPYLWNRNGHYYFRIAIPLPLAPRFRRTELTYSLRTKCPRESKRRCLALLQVAQWLFKTVGTMSRLTPEEIQQIAQNYFKEALRRLDCQLDTVESFSKGVKKRMNMDVLAWQGQSTTSPADVQQRLQAIKGTDLIFDSHRLDYLLPDNFKYENPNDPQEVTGMRLGFHNHFDGDSEAVTQYLVSKLSLDAEEGTLSYQSLKKGVERAIAELGRQQHKKLNLEGNLTIEDEWFAPSLPHAASPLTVQPVAYGVSAPISKVYASYLEECQSDKEKTIGKKKTTLELWLEINGDTSMRLLDKEKARQFKDVLRKLPKNMKQRYTILKIHNSSRRLR